MSPIWAQRMTSAWLAVTATMRTSFWPVRFVPGCSGVVIWPDGPGVGAAAGALFATGGGSSVPMTVRFWRMSFTDVWGVPRLMTLALLAGSMPVSWTATETITSTLSPVWMSVPTPVTWSTWTAIARRPFGMLSVTFTAAPDSVK